MSNPIDRSLAFTALLDLGYLGNRTASEPGREVTEFLEAWQAAGEPHMYDFAKEWVKTRGRV